MICALTFTCCTSPFVSVHESLKRNSHSSQRFIYHGTGAGSICELNELNRLEGTSFPTSLDDDEAAIRTMQQQFKSALDGLTRDNSELQAEVAQSRQQAASWQHSRRKSGRRESAWTRLGKPGDFSGAQDAWRDWSAVFREYGAAAGPRLRKLMTEAAKAATLIPKATIMEDEDRAASPQLCWIMLMICKGVALNIVLLVGGSQGFEAWRQLTEKYRAEDENTLRSLKQFPRLRRSRPRWTLEP